MSTEQPNMVDVALAAPEVGGVLSAIADQMAREAESRRAFADRLWIEALAEAKAAQDGVAYAVALCEYGGTTREYEQAMGRIVHAMHAAQNRYGTVWKWYVEQFTEDRFTKAVYPGYRVDYGP